MDIETEVCGQQDQVAGEEGESDNLDKLLHSAVTVSQARLPLHQIDEDIEDIASSYSEDNQPTQNALDEDFLRLIERTRQRRELLNQKMGKTPEVAPRKRRSPLSENLSSNLSQQARLVSKEESPKRQCVREAEHGIKPDTPAIPSVKSRLQHLASRHTQREGEADAGVQEESGPVPTPRKSLSSPPLERARPACVDSENVAPGSQRKNRFAQLARCINDWEDDLSHPTIVKEEEKKPRWQPPIVPSTAVSEKKSRAPAPPASVADTKPSVAAAQKAAPSTTKVTKETAGGSPVRSASKVGFNSSPKPYQPYMERKVSPVKSPAASKSNLSKAVETPTTTSVQASNQVTMRSKETPKTAPKPPAERPVSARLANWEQKIAETSVPVTPKSGLVSSSTVAHTPRQTCTPAPADEVMMRPKPRKSVEDEPTAHPVLARMSAWEQMSNAQVVSDIKKVRPGDCTPSKTPLPKTPVVATPGRAPTLVTQAKTATPSKAASVGGSNARPLAPNKSFKDSIKERAQQVNPGASTSQGSSSPPKSLSPKKASAAMKSVQEQLVQKTQSSSMAERLRQERMAELNAIQNRWKNGILQDDDALQPEQVPKTGSTPAAEKRETGRQKARSDHEEAMETDASDMTIDKQKLSQTDIPVTDKHVDDEIHKSNDNIVPCNSKSTCEISALQEIANTCTAQDLCKTDSLPGQSQMPLPEDLTKVTEPPTAATTESLTEGNLAPHNIDAGSREHEPDQGMKIESLTEKSSTEEAATRMDVDEESSGVEAAARKNEAALAPEAAPSPGSQGSKGAVVSGASQDSTASATATNTVNTELKELGSQKDNSHAEGLSCGNFDSKLSAMGFEPSPASAVSCPAPPPPPPASSQSKVSSKPPQHPRPTSLYNIVSQQKSQNSPSASLSKASRKVKFDDSFESDDSQASLPKKAAMQGAGHRPVELSETDSTEDPPSETTETDSDMEVVLRRPRPGTSHQPPNKRSEEDDDLSLSAFVPESVRRESIMPSPKKSGARDQDQDSSFGSVDSFEGQTGAPVLFHKSTVNLVRLGQQCGDRDSLSSLASDSTADSRSQLGEGHPQSGYRPDDPEDSGDERDAIGDLLEEAMDSEEEQPSTSAARSPEVVMRKKRPSHRRATEDGDLPFSIHEYRASRNMQILEVKQTITRNSRYCGSNVQEEEVSMPARPPVPVPRQSLQERIKQLQELVQQEQNVIMQTSNALNQCCSSASYFAGSTEQVECNRILLIACQKRQAYMTEIQRLRDSQVLDDCGPGPKGSLTISDIRLPLKKEFVTKIGTSQDHTTYYFILLLRNGPQIIVTQMLSTHDPMMRGSLDFPNLIKINGITGAFRLQLEIYSMSVSRESLSKDKRKKTPKKMKGSAMTVQSPGGPLAVRTTSFSQVTSVPLTMRSLDKHCFNLDRLSHLSPLHGMIYMNLKCLMEANVEERGFLTMFEDVSGLGSWHRRWCALSGNKLEYWKYPDDETRKDPIGYIDLKRCVTEKVGLIARDICARPNTFELASVRQPRRGEKDTLVTRTYNTMTTVRHMLSADTKEERIVWCNKLNRALANIRTWHSDAIRPIK